MSKRQHRLTSLLTRPNKSVTKLQAELTTRGANHALKFLQLLPAQTNRQLGKHLSRPTTSRGTTPSRALTLMARYQRSLPIGAKTAEHTSISPITTHTDMNGIVLENSTAGVYVATAAAKRSKTKLLVLCAIATCTSAATQHTYLAPMDGSQRESRPQKKNNHKTLKLLQTCDLWWPALRRSKPRIDHNQRSETTPYLPRRKL